ncbi:hypothetical protein SAE01_45900 [Segetibacter aerophilus]|uniref:Uncharacterized protein n=1 Tax=Segetibacter aerophilus TaxID=670293 RepID=A0A512BJG4_9BACT|nr:hypothetical protein SAE01_45900 [Segetibacter aerophilus]
MRPKSPSNPARPSRPHLPLSPSSVEDWLVEELLSVDCATIGVVNPKNAEKVTTPINFEIVFIVYVLITVLKEVTVPSQQLFLLFSYIACNQLYAFNYLQFIIMIK